MRRRNVSSKVQAPILGRLLFACQAVHRLATVSVGLRAMQPSYLSVLLRPFRGR